MPPVPGDASSSAAADTAHRTVFAGLRSSGDVEADACARTGAILVLAHPLRKRGACGDHPAEPCTLAILLWSIFYPNYFYNITVLPGRTA